MLTNGPYCKVLPNILWNGKFSIDVFYGTINVNKEPFFKSVW